MIPGAWSDRWRFDRSSRRAATPPPRIPPRFSRRRLRVALAAARALGFPLLLIVGLGAPPSWLEWRAFLVAAAVALFMLERLEAAQERVRAGDLMAVADAMDSDVALAATVPLSSRPRSRRAMAPVPPTPPRPRRRPSNVARLPLASSPRVLAVSETESPPPPRRLGAASALEAAAAQARSRKHGTSRAAPSSEPTTVCERFEARRPTTARDTTVDGERWLRARDRIGGSHDATVPDSVRNDHDDLMAMPKRRS